MSRVHRFLVLPLALLGCLALVAAVASAEQPPRAEPQADPAAAARGYRFLTEKAYLPKDFAEDVLLATWEQWPEPLRTKAAEATPDERRKLIFSRYGLTPRPDDPTRPLQYVVDQAGNWTMNCFACHGGKVAGKVIPGLANSHYALATLTEETRAVKVARELPLGRMDLGSVFVPLGSSNGTTNAVMFGVVLMAFRDAELKFVPNRSVPAMVHHDMDPPPWWHFKRKRMIYIDGFAEKGHRGLMQFMLVRSNGPEKFREWEADFRDVFAYLQSLQAPAYPFAIDRPLARQGEIAFRRVCADCHGTYGADGEYPERVIPIEEIGTDRVRLDALTPVHRGAYGGSWFADYGRLRNVAAPQGYVAPPLDGVWASGPYFHNGSVPTLWHVLHPAERPRVWRRTEDGYDQARVGLEIEAFSEVPAAVTEAAERRTYFETAKFGKSAAGHRFPDELTPDEKRAVLEYLKTL